MRSKQKRAFTLIELLVVISIIALLLAILMPSLNRAKVKTAQVVCLAHVRQVGIAITTYAVEYDGKYPPNPITGGTYVSPVFFNTTRAAALGYPFPFKVNLALQWGPYLGNSLKPFVDPSIPHMGPAETWVFDATNAWDDDFMWPWYYLGGEITNTTYGLHSRVTKMEDAPGTSLWSDHCTDEVHPPYGVYGDIRTNHVKRRNATRYPDNWSWGPGSYGRSFVMWSVPELDDVIGLNTFFNDNHARMVPPEEFIHYHDYFPPMKSLR